MKKVIAYVDAAGLVWADRDGLNSAAEFFEEYKESSSKTNIAELAALGYTADDLIKMKASGVL